MVVSKPLRTFADRVSLTEARQLQQEYLAAGLPRSATIDAAEAHASGNNPERVSREAVIQQNLEILTGQAGRDVVSDYTAIFLAPVQDPVWLPNIAGQPAVSFPETAPMLLLAMTESWRRLVLPMSAHPWTMFSFASLHDLADAVDFLEASEKLQETCPACLHRPFSAQLVRAYKTWGRDAVAAERVQMAVRDLALVVTASSQCVEKFHAGAQVGHYQMHSHGRKPATVQRSTYIMVARTCHSRMRARVERAVFGCNLHRARCLLKHRVVARSSTASSSLKGSCDATSKKTIKSVLKRSGPGKLVATSPWQAFLALRNRSRPNGISTSLQDEYHRMMGTVAGAVQLRTKALDMDRVKFRLVRSGFQQGPGQAAAEVPGAAMGGVGIEDLDMGDLPRDDSDDVLSRQQQLRLGQRTLDTALERLQNHPAWEHGLSVQDH